MKEKFATASWLHCLRELRTSQSMIPNRSWS